MSETIVQIVVTVSGVYVAAGLLFAIWLVSFGVQKLDSQAVGAPIFFRVLILPGAAALWPLFAYRFAVRMEEPPVEKNPHR